MLSLRRAAVLVLSCVLLLFTRVVAQTPIPGVKTGGSRNVQLLAHIPMGGLEKVADIEIEQELSRPYAYVSLMREESGFAIVDLRNTGAQKVLYQWTIENVGLHSGNLGWGGKDGKYFKRRGRYYYVQSYEFGPNSPDSDLGAIVYDVTGLPDTSRVKALVRIRATDTPGGFHNIFAYRHSDGRSLLLTTIRGPRANVYDMDRALAGDVAFGRVGTGIPIPESPGGSPGRGYHDFYAGYDPATHQDRFYGAGAGGYYVYDFTRPEAPVLLTSVTGVAGASGGHTFTPDPTGRYAIAETEYQYAPLRIFDLKPGLDGQAKNISRPIGAWNFDWKDLVHNHEVRWPYVFVSGYEDGLLVFNMMDPSNPYTVGQYNTCECPHEVDFGPLMNPPTTSRSVMQGAWGVDVRNADGLIVIGDVTSGYWSFKMEGFDGWNGHQWGLPNISSVQDWDNGPEGAPKLNRVS